MYDVINAKFAEANLEFRAHCQEAGVAPSRRQASKWRMGKGIASKAGKAVNAKCVVNAHEAQVTEARAVLVALLKKRHGNHADRRGIRQAINVLKAKRDVLVAAEAAHRLEVLELRKQRGVQ